MRRVLLVIVLVGMACRREATPEQIAERGWAATEKVVLAGERAASCKDAGIAMQRIVDEHRNDFIEAIRLDNDRKRLERAADYMASHGDRYKDLETRMEALSERCAEDATVKGVFEYMEAPHE